MSRLLSSWYRSLTILLGGIFLPDIEEITTTLTTNTGTITSIIIILLVTFIVAQIASFWINKTVSTVKGRSQSGSTKLVMLKHIIVSAIYAVGFLIILYTIPALRTFSTTLLASAGLATVVVGLAAQDTFGNMVSGLAIVFFRPFDIGDTITVKEFYGEVIDINLRQTTLKTFDNKFIVIPNSSLNTLTITNWTANTDPTVIDTLVFGISYGSDIERARQIMIDEARKCPFVMKTEEVRAIHGDDEIPDVKARVIALSPYSVDIRLDFWLYKRPDFVAAETYLREAIKKRIDTEPTVHIPYPHTTVVFGNRLETVKKD